MNNPLLNFLPTWAYVPLVALACGYLLLHVTRFLRTLRKHARQLHKVPIDDHYVDVLIGRGKVSDHEVHRLMKSVQTQRERL